MISETPDVTVKVSRELLTELATWSEPVQVMVEHIGGEYTMIARRHDCPIREAYGRGRDDEAAGAPIPDEMGA